MLGFLSSGAVQHTSASLTVNENADPDVRKDMETALNHLAPEVRRECHVLLLLWRLVHAIRLPVFLFNACVQKMRA